ncbi:MAG TPA: hypothetical protein V6D00_07925 [Pantanalinema sp.]
MRKMLLLAIATMGTTALMALPSEARPWHDHDRREADRQVIAQPTWPEQYRREVERQVVVQPIPGVEVRLPVQVVRPVERRRVIVVRERERHDFHHDWDRHDWKHRGPHREVIVVRR